MGTKSYQRKNSDYFHAFGVAATKKINDDGTELLTYTSIQQKLKHTEVRKDCTFHDLFPPLDIYAAYTERNN